MKTRFINNQFISIFNNHIIDYPTPLNLNYFWNFGFLAGIFFTIQLLTGIFLVMHYTPHIDYAFISVEHIMRDVNNGWLIRYIHANGASFFFLCVYIHMFRGFYYGSYMYPRNHVWVSGVLIFLIMILTAFTGYVLPWGQMSFWAATVITNLVSAIPLVGNVITQWLWGGFSVGNATLNRFFSLHYLLPFVLIGLVVIHIGLVHNDGSNNPLGISSKVLKISFYPYFYLKDLFGLIIFFIFFFIFIYYLPNVLGHTDNYIPANPLVTPAHIVPEWYFLPFYAILRSIPHKLGGVIAMGLSIIVLCFIPYLNNSKIRNTSFRPFFLIFYWFFIIDYFILGWIGQKIVESPFIEIGQIATIFYFFFLLIILPYINKIENILIYDNANK